MFWGQLCDHFGVEWRLSTAFCPQTDGPTKRMNAGIEKYLCVFLNNPQDNWEEWLPMANFAPNNSVLETTKGPPCFAIGVTNPSLTFWMSGTTVGIYYALMVIQFNQGWNKLNRRWGYEWGGINLDSGRMRMIDEYQYHTYPMDLRIGWIVVMFEYWEICTKYIGNVSEHLPCFERWCLFHICWTFPLWYEFTEYIRCCC